MHIGITKNTKDEISNAWSITDGITVHSTSWIDVYTIPNCIAWNKTHIMRFERKRLEPKSRETMVRYTSRLTDSFITTCFTIFSKTFISGNAGFQVWKQRPYNFLNYSYFHGNLKMSKVSFHVLYYLKWK